jgi:hypothetical protein
MWAMESDGRIMRKKVKPWRFAVSQAALETGHESCSTGPVYVGITFLFPAAQIAPTTAKGCIKPNAPLVKNHQA